MKGGELNGHHQSMIDLCGGKEVVTGIDGARSPILCLLLTFAVTGVFSLHLLTWVMTQPSRSSDEQDESCIGHRSYTSYESHEGGVMTPIQTSLFVGSDQPPQHQCINE